MPGVGQVCNLPIDGDVTEPIIQCRRDTAMLNFWGNKLAGDCETSNRRDFLKVGSLGLTGLGLSGLLRDRAAAGSEGRVAKDTSVVWIWLGGGATHIETFDPKM